MTDGARHPAIRKSELFLRLAEGHAARTVVVTPNQRLARELSREFQEDRQRAGLVAWETPDILPLSAFVERLYDDALYGESSASLPKLLTPVQEWELWQWAIRSSPWGGALLAVASTAEECRRAWALAHEWDIAGVLGSFPGNEDARAFEEWARAYVRRCQADGNTDATRLPDIVAPLLANGAIACPLTIVAYGFDVLPPQAGRLLAACEQNETDVRLCAPDTVQGRTRRLTFPSARAELEAAAQWARNQLEAGASRIGVVVPELGQRRKEVERIFAQVMAPAHNLPGAVRQVPPFNVSLGAPLSDFALVRVALSVLELAAGDVPFEQASKLVRSPFLGGGESEFALRASLDAALRKRAPTQVALGKLVGLTEDAPQLRRHLEALFVLAREYAAVEGGAHEWARSFSDLLDSAGFPGERELDSAEFQTLAKLNETLAEFARLGRIAPHLSLTHALAQLRHLCAETLFQPETPDAPIQVLGVLESAGLEFDALWVSGLTDDAWPLALRINPFIPPVLQRRAGIPESSAEATLARCKRITAGWLSAASEVRVSHPAMDRDRELLVSPLLAGVPLGQQDDTNHPRYRDLIFASRRAEEIDDGQAPALPTKAPFGGTRILSDQAACPFRAYARHRLGAEALEEPVPGPDARTRGQLLHGLMKTLWNELKDSDALAGDCAPAIRRAAAAAVADAKLEEPFAALERTRLGKLAAEWLDVERTRPPFAVVATEEKRKLAVAGLELNGRIDRMDSLASGGHALVDYKTGRPTPNEWMGERPDDPQLPLYALTAKEDVVTVAFAKLKTGEMRYMGFSAGEDRIPGVKASPDWEALLAGWKREIESLGNGFATGDARVNPKKGLQTCRYCDLQPLCRVYEKLNALDEGDDD